ncbi:MULTISPECIES: hypothetical protein [Psychrilyobacter]|uniref:hypothetical protein n=1 Tax=Psychrilyobacter TaxID=623282 RepID=UPI001313D802|nr:MULTISPECIES: hypothetical protein [Psychrilyobacter]MCS5422009.1 hypothetical protein [Psychrilyobacter sp. S5]NDI78931.1 hypothetical protein [Psychrilyobacter piezotolerans]
MNKVSTTGEDKDKNMGIVKKKELSEFKKMQYIRCPIKAIIINNNLFKESGKS